MIEHWPHGRDKTVATLAEFCRAVEAIRKSEVGAGNPADLLFRGQARFDWHLLPKLGRQQTKGHPSNIENLMFKEFKRTSFPFVQRELSDWEYLALAQHHGLPTRLLDWSYSALAALWFAVSGGPCGDADGVVWVLAARTQDFAEPSARSSPLGNDGRTRVYRPMQVSPRIVAQAGVFTAHKLKDGAFVPLERNSYFKHKLTRLRISAAKFPTVKKQLEVSGVNAAVLLPDLSGLCEYLTERYVHPGTRPGAGREIPGRDPLLYISVGGNPSSGPRR